MFLIEKAGTESIPVIRKLAAITWPVAYGQLLSPDQLQYMLGLFYSESSLQQQMEDHRFFIVKEDHQPVGFASYSIKQEGLPGIYHLHKLYVDPAQQGKGTGKLLLEHIINEIKRSGGTELQLHVKRDNKAQDFYKKLGFTITGEINTDIGNNYFMRDYVMTRIIQH